MPLTALQRRVLKVIAARRDPESYVAGGSVINLRGPRRSADIDLFHDREERVAGAAAGDAWALETSGLAIEWRRRDPTFFRAVVRDRNGGTRLDWAVDSDYRFYPTQADPIFGYTLHPLDLATNKLLAAADRFEVRDAIDLSFIERRVMPLGPLAWAAAEKSPGFTPEGLIAEVRAKARYTQALIDAEDLARPVTAAGLNKAIRLASQRALDWLARIPASIQYGAFVDAEGEPFAPDPGRDDLDTIPIHRGRRGGAWPSSPEITSAMLRHQLGGGEDP